MVQMGRRRDGDGIDAFRDQLVELGEGAAIGKFRRPRPMRRQGIDNPDQIDVRQARQDPGVIAAHDAGADNPDAQRAFRLDLEARSGTS